MTLSAVSKVTLGVIGLSRLDADGEIPLGNPVGSIASSVDGGRLEVLVVLSDSDSESSSTADSESRSEAECPTSAAALLSSRRAARTGRFWTTSLIDPRREREWESCTEGLRDVPEEAEGGGPWINGFTPLEDARRGAGAPEASGLNGLGSFMDGLLDTAAESTVGVGGPSWP